MAKLGNVGYVVLRPLHSMKTMTKASKGQFLPSFYGQQQTSEWGGYLPGEVLASLAPGMHVPNVVGAEHLEYYVETLERGDVVLLATDGIFNWLNIEGEAAAVVLKHMYELVFVQNHK